MRWMFLMLFLLQPASPPDLNITWREPQTIRVMWSGQRVVCVWLDGWQLDLPCAAFGTRLIGIGGIDVQVDPGMVLELRSEVDVVASQIIPPNPFPQNLTVTPNGALSHITWQTPSGNIGCVVRADPLFPQTLAPCAPSGAIDVAVAPGSRVALLISGIEVARVILPLPAPSFTVRLPLVIR